MGGILIAVAVGLFFVLSGKDSKHGTSGPTGALPGVGPTAPALAFTPAATATSEAVASPAATATTAGTATPVPTPLPGVSIELAGPGGWVRRTVPGGYVLAANQQDTDTSRAPAGPRFRVENLTETGSSVSLSSVQSADPARLKTSFDIVDDPFPTSVGPTAASAVTIWEKDGEASPAVVRRYYFVTLAIASFLVVAEAPADQWAQHAATFNSMIAAARLNGASPVASPPAPTPSGPIPGPGWPLVFRDRFGPSTSGWRTGTLNDSRVTGVFEVQDGRMVFDFNVISTITYAPTKGDPVGDFYLSVDAQRLGSGLPFYGVCFRRTENQMYAFYMDDTRLWHLMVRTNGAADRDLVPANRSNLIIPGQVNRIEVLMTGGHIVVSINGQKLAEADDNTLATGAVGFYLYQIGSAKLQVAYDNFELHTP